MSARSKSRPVKRRQYHHGALAHELIEASLTITAFAIQDDEMMTERGTRALYSLYEHAPLEVRRVRPADHGLRAIGHFGFFRPKMQAALWPLVAEWIERRFALAPEPAPAR